MILDPSYNIIPSGDPDGNIFPKRNKIGKVRQGPCNRQMARDFRSYIDLCPIGPNIVSSEPSHHRIC